MVVLCRSRQRIVHTVHLVTLTGWALPLPLAERRAAAPPAPDDGFSAPGSPPPLRLLPALPRWSSGVVGPRSTWDGGEGAEAGTGAAAGAGTAFRHGETGTTGRGWRRGEKLDARVTISRYLSSMSAWIPEPP